MISAIVLSMNNGDTLDACLKSVVDSLPCDKEVIVVDGHSTDNTPSILAKYKDKIKVVYDEGKGLGLARNVGVYHAKYDIIAFVDSDVICAKDHFQKILDCFTAHPDVGGVDTAGIHPQTGSKVQQLESLLYATIEREFPNQPAMRGWCLSFRRSVWKAVGGFWRTGSDDGDFSYKVREAGFKLASVETDSWHVPRRSMLDVLKEMKLWGRNVAYFYYKWENHPLLVQDISKGKMSRLLRNTRITTFVAYLAAPVTGVRYYLKTKRLSLYLYFIVRQYAHLLGFMRGNLDIAFNSPRLVGVIREA